MKKFTSLLLALVMALSLAIPAFAASGNSETSLGQSTKISSTTNEATIKVTVPATLTAALNPYGIGYKINDTWVAAQTYNQGQVASQDNLIISQSNIPLDVYVNAVGTPTSGVTLESASVGTKKTKSVFMYAVFGTVDTGLVTASDISDAVGAAHKNVAPPVYPTTLSTTPDATTQLVNQIIIKTTALSKAVKVGTLAEVPYSSDAPQTISAIAYKLDGDMVIAPENNGAANNWVKTDKVDVEFTFTFVPGTAEVAADYTEATALSYSFGDPADLTWDAKAKLTAATTVTTAPHATDATAAYDIDNVKVDGVAVATAANVAIANTGVVTIKKELFSGTGITGAQITVRQGETTHYVAFDISYVDVNSWNITKTIKLPITIGA